MRSTPGTTQARAGAEQTLPPSLFRSVDHLGTHFGESPAVIVVGGTGAPPPGGRVAQFAMWYRSLYPAVQNLIIALRAHGLGTALTTMVTGGTAQAETKALLEIPDDVTLIAALPVAYPKGALGRPPRAAVEEVAHHDRWGTALRQSEDER